MSRSIVCWSSTDNSVGTGTSGARSATTIAAEPGGVTATSVDDTVSAVDKTGVGVCTPDNWCNSPLPATVD